MTNILFKAKRTDTREWVEGLYFKTPLTDENSGTDPSMGWFFLSDGVERFCIAKDGVAFVVDPETRCQLSPITDDKDIKIWEGDIVQFGEEIENVGEVMFSDNVAAFVVRDKWGQVHSLYSLESRRTITVIGNRFDNPDLLKTSNPS